MNGMQKMMNGMQDLMKHIAARLDIDEEDDETAGGHTITRLTNI